MPSRALVSSALILAGMLGPFAVLAVGPTDANRVTLALLLTLLALLAPLTLLALLALLAALTLLALLAALALALRPPRAPHT